jgi:hypothetical protein
VQLSVNDAGADVAPIGLVMTIIPDPLAVVPGGVYVADATARVPALLKASVRVGPFPLGSFQW